MASYVRNDEVAHMGAHPFKHITAMKLLLIVGA
jgi:hypothetical protein